MRVDPPKEVLDSLTNWKPGDLATEFDYHKSLEAFLREKFPKARVEREYRHNGTTADLFVSLEKLIFTYELHVIGKAKARYLRGMTIKVVDI